MSTLHRIDPPGCGCTDCLTGWSKPLEQATDKEVRRMIYGSIQDASGIDHDALNAHVRHAQMEFVRAYCEGARR